MERDDWDLLIGALGARPTVRKMFVYTVSEVQIMVNSDAISPDLTSLPHISEVIPLGPSDQTLIDELVVVLKKHHALNRFGLALLHHHFPCAADEILVETTDIAERTQTIRPVPRADLGDEHQIETIWRLDMERPIAACTCLESSGGDHTGNHHSTQ